MNSFVWAVWAAQGSREQKVDLNFSEQLLRVFFFYFLCAKNWGRTKNLHTLPVKMFGLGQKVLSRSAWSKFWPILAKQLILTSFHGKKLKKKKCQTQKKKHFFKMPILNIFWWKFHWFSRNEKCKGHWFSLTCMAVRLSYISWKMT